MPNSEALSLERFVHHGNRGLVNDVLVACRLIPAARGGARDYVASSRHTYSVNRPIQVLVRSGSVRVPDDRATGRTSE